MEDSMMGRPLMKEDTEGGGRDLAKDRFPEASVKYRDPFWALLFMANVISIFIFAGFYGVPALNLGLSMRVEKISDGRPTSLSSGMLELVGGVVVVCGCAAALSFVWVRALLWLAASLFEALLLGAVAFLAVVGALLLAQLEVVGGSICMVLALLAYCYYRFLKPRLEFAAANLKVACEAVVGMMPSPLFAALVLLGLQLLYCLGWALAVVGVATALGQRTITDAYGNSYDLKECTTMETEGPDYTFSSYCDGDFLCYKCVCNGSVVYEDEGCLASDLQGGEYVLLLLSLLWGCSVISNILHCTTSGAVAAWWFSEGPTRAPVMGSFRRAATTSLGSICLGSLLVAIVSTLRYLVSQSVERFGRRMNVLKQILECLLGMLERFVRYFNKYAFCYVAIYGSDFKTAGKEVSQLFANRGWTAIINDDLTSRILRIGCFVVAIVTGYLGWLYSQVFTLEEDEAWLLVGFGIVIGFVINLLLITLIESAVATVFVCFAEDSQALLESHPKQYMELTQTWKKIHGHLLHSYYSGGDEMDDPIV